MEDEKVDQEKKDLFNLGYVLGNEGGGHLYDTLTKQLDSIPDFKNSDAFKALEAGKRQAERDLNEQYLQQGIIEPHTENRDEITEDRRPTFEQWIQDRNIDDWVKKNKPELTSVQQKELDDHNKWLEGGEARKEFKAKTRDIKSQGIENSDHVEKGETREEYQERMRREREARQNDKDMTR